MKLNVPLISERPKNDAAKHSFFLRGLFVAKYRRLKKDYHGRKKGSVVRIEDVQRRRTLRARAIDSRMKAKIAKNVEEWARQPNRRDLKGVDYPKGARVKTPPKQGVKTHTHWMVTPDGKYRERIEHPMSQKHTNVYSQRRHSLETGAMQRWLKKRNLKMLDANKERYEREVIVPMIKKQEQAKHKISEYNKKRAQSAQKRIDRLKREGHPYRGLKPNHPEVKLMIARSKLNKQLFEGKISRDEWNKRWSDTKKSTQAKTPKKQERAKDYLQVLWTRKSQLKHKDFPLGKEEQAFNWYWRTNGDQIVLRQEGKYGHSFSESNVSDFRQKHPTKEGYKKEFDTWLKDSR